MFENNHDRTRYILSLMGYSLFKPTNENKESLKTKIYCFQKGLILTLHDKSLDFYSETEKNLFLKIINAISKSKNESFSCYENEQELEKSIENVCKNPNQYIEGELFVKNAGKQIQLFYSNDKVPIKL